MADKRPYLFHANFKENNMYFSPFSMQNFKVVIRPKTKIFG
jgi:hypothetical protein